MTDRTPITDEQERRWFSSATEYFRDLIRIQGENKQLVPFERNEVQKVVVRIKRDIVKHGRLIRLVILKARRFGISTNELMEMLRETAITPLTNALIIAHDPATTNELFEALKRAWRNIPFAEMQPRKKNINAKALVFEGIDSSVVIGTAGSENVGSGTLKHHVLLSELAKYPPHTVSDILTSLFQTIPSIPGTQLIMESTAYGTGGEFPKQFWGARFRYVVFLKPDGDPGFRCDINPDAKKENEFSCIFIPWFVAKKYRRDPDPGFQRTPKETELALMHGLNDTHLAWRRWAIENKCKGSEQTFCQEYPSTPEEAFLASGRPVFDPIAQVRYQMNACRPAMAYYMLQAGNWVATQPIAGDTNGLLQVWKEYDQMKTFMISGDIAEGLEYGDWDSASVCDQRTGEQVAHWHGHTSPDKFGEILYHMGKRYGDGWIAPERNLHGLMTITILVNMGYENIIPELNVKPGEKPKKHYGFFTGSSKTGGKGIIIDEFAAWFRVNPDLIKCRELCAEMLTFINKADGSMGAEYSHFDDRIMDIAINNFCRTRLPRPTRNSEVIMNTDSIGANAWT